jgi:hypothetical protein
MAEMYEHGSQRDRNCESKPTQDPEALVLVVLTDHSAFGSRAIGVGDGRRRAEHGGDFLCLHHFVEQSYQFGGLGGR